MYVPILSARPSSRNSDPEHGARGENMSDDKIKIKDLSGDISQDPKDILRVARELGLSVKSATGSVTSEEATRLRDYFAEQKQVDAERAGAQRDVIVRRRRNRLRLVFGFDLFHVRCQAVFADMDIEVFLLMEG